MPARPGRHRLFRRFELRRGVCASPESNTYISGLSPFHDCVRLTIEGGGPNDADGTSNHVIRDPGGLAIPPQEPAAPAASNGRIGVMHPLLLSLLLGGCIAWRRVRS